MKNSILALVVSLPTFACTSDKSDSGGGRPTINTFAKLSELPPCDDSRDSLMVYVEEQTSMLICKSGSWINLGGSEVASEVPSTETAPQSEAAATVQVGREGKDGSDGKTLYVIDGKDQKIGLFGGLSSEGFSVFFSNSGYTRIHPETGMIPDDVVVGCKFESDDCSGACLSVSSPANPIGNVVIGASLYVAKGAKKSGVTAKSSWNPRAKTCTSGLSSPLSAYYETALIDAVAYPVPLPLTVQAK